jgi:hypothetical protein
MKKILLICLFAIVGLTTFSQNNTGKQYIPWLKSDYITIPTGYFVWHGDTIDFTQFVDSLYLSLYDSTKLYVTPAQMMDSLANLGAHDTVSLNVSATTGGMTLIGQEIGNQSATASRNGYLTKEDFDLFYKKLTTVTTDASFTGNGTEASPLKLANALGTVVTDGIVEDDNIAIYKGTSGDTIQDGGYTVAELLNLGNAIGTLDEGNIDPDIARDSEIPVISNIAYGVTWDGVLDGASKNAIYDVISALPGGHDAVTLGTANGLSLSGQELSLGLSGTASTGALNSTDWNTFNAYKLDSASINRWSDTLGTVIGLATAYDISLLNTAGNMNNVMYLNNTQTATGQKTFSNVTTKFGSTGAASWIQLISSTYPQILFTTPTDSRILFRNGNLLQWRFDGTNDGELYHSFNSNLSTVSWAANNITAAGTIIADGKLTATTARFTSVVDSVGVSVLGLTSYGNLTTNALIDTSDIVGLAEFIPNHETDPNVSDLVKSIDEADTTRWGEIITNPAQTLTYSDTVVFDVDSSGNAIVTISGNVSVLNIDNIEDGESGTIVIIQDDTGGWGIDAIQSEGLIVKYVYLDTTDYIITEVDPTVSNLVKSIDAADTTRWGIDTDTQLSEAQVDAYADDNGYLDDDSNYYKLNSANTGAGIISYSTGFTFNNDRQLVDKAYVDAIAAGNMPKLPVDAATTANITLSGTQTIDSYAVTAGMRVLVKNQSTSSQNGVYTVAAGAWARSTDLDTWTELYKAYVAVLSGGQSGSSFVCTIASTGNLGTDAVTWVLYSAPANIVEGDGINKVGNVISAEFGGTGVATTVSRTDHTQAATTIGGGTISDTEFSYLDNATSNIQTQLNAKVTGTTGLLTESVTGLQFSGTPSVVGGASALSLTTNYFIPLKADSSKWAAGYNNSVTALSVTGTTTKTVTATQQDGGTVVSNTFTDNVNDADYLTTNELQTVDTFRLSGTNLELSLSSDGQAKKTVSLSGLAGSSLFTDSGGAFSYLTDTGEDLGIGSSTDLGDYKFQVTGNQYLKGNAKFSTNGVAPAYLEMEDVESTLITPTAFHGALFVDSDSLWYKNSLGVYRNLLRSPVATIPLSTSTVRGGVQIGYVESSLVPNNFKLRLSTDGSEDAYTTIVDASTTVKGIAKFNSNNFSVSAGLVSGTNWLTNGNFIDMVDITDQVRIGTTAATGTWDLYVEGQISTGYLGSRGIITATNYISTEEYIISDYLTTRNVSSMSATVPNEGNFYSKTDNKAYFQANNVEFDLTNTVEKFRTIAVNTTLTTTDKIVFVSAGGTVVTYPTVPTGKIYTIRNIASSSITVPTYTILGANTTATTVASYQCVTLCYTGSAWYQID